MKDRGFLIVYALVIVILTIAYWVVAELLVKEFGGNAEQCILLYQSSIRTPVFSGFITMGSFLLALKTNILGRLKETYQTAEYRSTYRLEIERSKRPGGPQPGKPYYGDLERLSRTLGWNVVLCLVTAFCQLTIGFINNVWAFALCCGLATACLFLLIYLTNILMSAHEEWFKMIEKEAQAQLAALDKLNQADIAKADGQEKA